MEKSINFLIDHQCPQCGAPATLHETDRLFRCAFCKVKSYLMEPGYFRYRLPHRVPAGRDLMYLPYWRFKGMLFTCLPTGIQHRFLDVSQQAIESACFPPSVGLRSQAMKLRFVNPDDEGWFIKPSLPVEGSMETFLARFNRDFSGPILHQSHIGESVSIVYAPFYPAKRMMDGILNEPVSDRLDDDFEPSQFPGGPADWRIHFMPTLCPACGWDMHGSRDALVLNCANCESMWQASPKGMRRVNAAHMPGGDDATTVYLPFWRIQADVDGVAFKTYADLVRLANLPRVVKPAWEGIACHFWGPAFKVRPKSFLRLTHQITLAQPRDGLVARLPKGALHPVNLPVSESIETLKLNLSGIIRPKQTIQGRIADIQVKARRYLLVYLPFEMRHHDLVQTTFKIAVNRNQLALADNL